MISVIIPTFNRRVYVQIAIDSILAQTYYDYEIIVVDDGSTDGTEEALSARYGARIVYHWQENQGESVARNHGLSIARGEYIALLDSDDVWLPEKLAKQKALLDQRRDVGVVFCQAWIIDQDGQRREEHPLGDGQTDHDLTLERLVLDNDVVGPSTSMIRREVLEQVGGFDAAIHYGEDWDLWLRIAARYPMSVLPEPLACLRRHRSTQSYYPSTEKNARRLQEHVRVMEKAFASWPGQPPTGLRETAFARRYLQAGVNEMAADNQAAATEDFRTAQRLKPELLSDAATFGQWIINQAALLTEDGQRASFERAWGYAQQVFVQINTIGALDPVFKRYILAQLAAMLGFVAHQHHHPDLVRRYSWQAIKYDQRWAYNRGVLKRLVGSIVAGKSSAGVST